MNPIARITVGVAALLLAVATSGTRAADLSEPVVLVARASLDNTPFAQTVVIAAPAPGGAHIGFVVNRPSQMKLDTLFPDQEPAHNVAEPVYLGGPSLPNGLFAVLRDAPADMPTAIPLLPGVVVVFDGNAIDRLIEQRPNAARYFLGMMQWDTGELEQQISNGLWEVQSAEPQNVLPVKARGLWNSLRSPMASIAAPAVG
jgi:putative AlgH/UPF0301 family transcriptional regulator